MSSRIVWLAFLVAMLFSGVVGVNEAKGQAAMEKDVKRNLMEFLVAVKRATEEGAFADPKRLNETIPVSVKWKESDVINRSHWVSAEEVILKETLFPSTQVRYRLLSPGMWRFAVANVSLVACVSFDELVSVVGGGYQVAPRPYRHHKSGSPIVSPGPQKMAGETLFYRFRLDGFDKRLSVRMDDDGCVENVSTWQVREF